MALRAGILSVGKTTRSHRWRAEEHTYSTVIRFPATVNRQHHFFASACFSFSDCVSTQLADHWIWPDCDSFWIGIDTCLLHYNKCSREALRLDCVFYIKPVPHRRFLVIEIKRFQTSTSVLMQGSRFSVINNCLGSLAQLSYYDTDITQLASKLLLA